MADHACPHEARPECDGTCIGAYALLVQRDEARAALAAERERAETIRKRLDRANGLMVHSLCDRCLSGWHEHRRSDDGLECPREQGKPWEERERALTEAREGLADALAELESLLSGTADCGDPDAECPLHDSHKSWSTAGLVKRLRALAPAPAPPAEEKS